MSTKSIKLYFETGRDSGHNVRGIGVHNTELLKRFEKFAIHLTTKKEADIIHFTYFKPFAKPQMPFNKPKNQKWVLTIHDLIPLIYPNHYPAGIKGKLRFVLNKYLIKRNIDAVITISETSKKDICRFLKIDPKKVFVIYLASKKIFNKTNVLKKYDLPKRFALYTGDINYNKNISNLVKACKIAKIPLVIAGGNAKEIERLDLNHPELSHLRSVDFRDVTFFGFATDEDLCNLYNLASVYIQPSLYEGFGFPVLEAVSCKTPIVVSRTQALVEILGKNLKYVNPYDPKDIAKGILDPNINIKLPRDYSWQKTAKETVEVYEKILKQ